MSSSCTTPAPERCYANTSGRYTNMCSMRSPGDVQNVLDLIAQGLTASEASNKTGIPRGTVTDWANGHVPGRALKATRCPVCNQSVNLAEPAYAYLLGVYLGDGCISPTDRTYRLRIFMDSQYPQIIAGCVAAMEGVSPGKTAHVWQHKNERCAELSMYWNHWPCLFPQHGPGKKHDRPIELAPWQEELVSRYSEELVKGLIHSDGCRIVASDRGRPSVRYHFSNLSEDIKHIYCAALDRLGIPWTRPCSKQIAVYRKAAAARMDEFIGPKS